MALWGAVLVILGVALVVMVACLIGWFLLRRRRANRVISRRYAGYALPGDSGDGEAVPSDGGGVPAPPPKPLGPPTIKDRFVKNLRNHLIVRVGPTLHDQRFTARNLEGCRVLLFGFLDSVMVDDCKECEFFIGPTSGSVFFRDCTACAIHSASTQLRLNDSTDMRCCVWIRQDPAIENCN
eukprot:gene138-2354_t